MPCDDGGGGDNDGSAMISMGLKCCCWEKETDGVWARVMPLGV